MISEDEIKILEPGQLIWVQSRPFEPGVDFAKPLFSDPDIIGWLLYLKTIYYEKAWNSYSGHPVKCARQCYLLVLTKYGPRLILPSWASLKNEKY